MDLQSLKILHLTPTVGKGSTGLGTLSLDLAKAQNQRGYNAELWSIDSQAELRWASESSSLGLDRLRGFARTPLGIPGLSFGMEREAARSHNQTISVVHQHGLWTGVSRVTSILRRVHNAATVVAPQGSLHIWALQKSQWKKRLALALYENRNLAGCSCLQAVSEMEISDFRDFGLRNPIAVIPNGVSIEWLESQGNPAAFRHQFGIPDGKRILLFLSRVSPKKGLKLLLEAVRMIGEEFAEWQLVIAGADEFGHQAELERTIRDTGLDRSVLFVGPLFNQLKRDAYAAADLFVLPSFSEGAPVVILEALAAGIPVIATTASPWRDLETYECGWWVDIDARAISKALKHAVSCSVKTLHAMGQKGRDLAGSRYSWDASARMTIELYEWLRGRNERPEFVVTT
jgi:glycosyltransferase involved in cell wall biosynthesis